jgi:plastocyanin
MDAVRVRVTSELYFEPADVTVAPGTRVIWTVDADMMKCLEHHVVVRRLDFLVSSDARQGHRRKTRGADRLKSDRSNRLSPPRLQPWGVDCPSSDDGGRSVDANDSGADSPPFSHDTAVFESPAMYTGDEWSHVFTRPGVFTVENSTYEMVGRVFVEDAADELHAGKSTPVIVQTSNRVRSESCGSGVSSSMPIRPARTKPRKAGVSTDPDGSSVESASVSNVSVATSSTGRATFEATTRMNRVAVSTLASAVHVTIRGFQFVPTHVRVTVGQSIVWTNSADSEYSHAVESACGRVCSPVLPPGKSFTLVIGDDAFSPGVIRYCNPVYSFMKGEIIVARSASLEDVRDSDHLLAAYVHRWSPSLPVQLPAVSPPPVPQKSSLPPQHPPRSTPKPAPDSPLRGFVTGIHSLVPVKKPASPSRPAAASEPFAPTLDDGALLVVQGGGGSLEKKKKRKKKRGRKSAQAGSVISSSSVVSDVTSEASSAYTSSECGTQEGPVAVALSTLGLSGRALRDMPVPNVHGCTSVTAASDSDDDAPVIHRKHDSIEVDQPVPPPWMHFLTGSAAAPALHSSVPVATFNPRDAAAFFTSRAYSLHFMVVVLVSCVNVTLDRWCDPCRLV